jgi:hypothetical protein
MTSAALAPAAIHTRKHSEYFNPPVLSVWLFGIILPISALMVELSGHPWGSEVFDPIPTWLHVCAIASLPFSCLLCWWRSMEGLRLPQRWLVHLQTFSIGIAAAYTLVFIPFMPFAGVGLLFGIGFLPLAPFFALIASLRLRFALARIHALNRETIPRWWPGFLTAIALLGLVHGRIALTHWMLDKANSLDTTTRSRALTGLRWAGDNAAVLRACYATPTWDFRGFYQSRIDEGAVEHARKMYYRLTGDAYSSVPAPATAGLRMGRGRWNWDPALGGERVAGKVDGLSLTSSRMDGHVETASATGYMEWTLVFTNVAANASEARAQIELPPGGVVSRLTLWINGEPREAAFGSRGQVRAAYQEVAVAQQRDPVLVTTSGPDRVLMQCFPVPRNGGEMKVRIGITAPLRLESGMALELPRFLETNFAESAPAHHLWFESDAPIGLGKETPVSKLRAELTPSALAAGLTIRSSSRPREVIADDPSDPSFVIRQTLQQRQGILPSGVVFVVDGSKHIDPFLGHIADAVGTVPDGLPFTVVYAGEGVDSTWDDLRPADDASRKAAAAWLRRQSPAGGSDNLPALVRAWDIATSKPGAVLVWVHGPQPVLLSDVAGMLQRIEREKNKPVLLDFAMAPAPNRILEKLDRLTTINSMPRAGGPMDSFRHQIALWRPDFMETFTARERIPTGPAGAKGGRDVVRLWANEESARLHAGGDTKAAVKLAVAAQLVTPITGAVVLETQAQYDRHNLKPADSGEPLLVPEPASAMLLALAGASLLARRRRATGRQ